MNNDLPNTNHTDYRTEQTKLLLNEIDEYLSRWRKINFNEALPDPNLEQTWRDIDRARRQFDAKLFFIVIFGPLKAGKSTLTNALAGEYVSPAGFGKETTRRPSLVIRDNKSCIQQYFSNDHSINNYLSQRKMNSDQVSNELSDNKEKVQEAFDIVADFLRGIRTEEELQGRIRINILPLNDGNLEQALTQDLETEPLFTVIRCKGGQLLDSDVAIVDMPGLDGNSSNWRDDPIHEWVIKRSEFFLFVQSSVAAWNRETRDFVKQVIAQSTKPPIWLIQNIFDARHWQPEEKRKNIEEQQREEGKKRVIELLEQAPRAVLGLNLGKAWDGKIENQEKWLIESMFPIFESNLAEVLHAERQLIQERNCIEYLRKELSGTKDQLVKATKKIDDIRKEYSKVKQKVQNVESILAKTNYRSKLEENFKFDLIKKTENVTNGWLENLENEISAIKQKHNQERTGKEVNDDLSAIASTLSYLGSSKYFLKSYLLPDYWEIVERYCKYAESDILNECNKLLEEIKFKELPTPIMPSEENLPQLLNEKFSNTRLNEKKSFLYMGFNSWVDKKYNGSEIQIHITSVASEWKRQIQNRKELWVNNLFNMHFTSYCENRRSSFSSHVKRLFDDFEAYNKQNNEAADATERIIIIMNEGLRKLEQPIDNAFVSLK